jgi:hydrogenase maturation protease
MSLRAERSNLSQLKRELATARKVVILGIGNELYNSDSPGLLAAKELQKLSSSSDKYQVFLVGPTPENFTGAIRKASPSHVILIDAADMGKKPGTIEIINKSNVASVSPSTHSVSLSLLTDYLTQDIGCKVIILGIQPGTTLPKEEALIKEAIRKLASLLCQNSISKTTGLEHTSK